MYIRLFVCLFIWEFLFQFGFAQSWSPMNGPIGTDINSSVITKEKGEIYCMTITSKVFMSTDNGKTWVEQSDGLKQFSGARKSIKEAPNGTIYLNNGDFIYRYDKLIRKWISLYTNNIGFEDFAFSPDGLTIYSSSGNSLLISNNNGYFKIVNNLNAYTIAMTCLGNNNNFILNTNGEIWKFSDDGSNLKLVLGNNNCQKLFFSNSTKILYGLTGNSCKYSEDFGVTWKTIIYKNNFHFKNFIELNNGTLLSFYSNKFYSSTDNGNNWNLYSDYAITNKNNSIFNSDDQITLSKSGNLLINTCCESFYLEPNSICNKLEMPIKEVSIKKLKILNNGDCYVSSYGNTQYSIDDGNSWNHIYELGGSDFLLWNDGTIGTLKLHLNSINITSDRFSTLFTKSLPQYKSVSDVLLDKNDNLIAISSDSTYISYDKATTWSSIGKVNHNINKFQFSRNNLLYSKEFSDSIFYSTDLGINWKSFPSQNSILRLPLFVSAHNVFYWTTFTFFPPNQILQYTKDFGQTLLEYNIMQDEKILLIDDFDNIYIRKNNENYLKVINLIENREYSLSLNGLDLSQNQSIQLDQGNNDYLYAHKAYSPLYKFSVKLQDKSSVITSFIFIDQNNDCKINNSESYTKSLQLELIGKNNNYTLSPLLDGKYSAYINADNYQVKIKDKNSIWELCNFPTQLQVLPNQNVVLDSLIIKPKLNCVDLITGLSLSRLRRCFDGNQAFISIRNEGTIDAKDTKIQIILDDSFAEVTCNVNPLSRIGNLWTFDVPSVKVGETFRITFTFKVSCDARLNQEHCIKGIIEDKNDCFLPLQLLDTIIICDENIGSFDPNDKMVYINGIQSPTFHKTDSVLEYLIRFQNTGTDTAFTVVIKDQLDYNLDWSSLTPISASHDYSYFLGDGGTMEIKFANILLPDSSINYTASNGYFKYNIKPKRDLNFGTKIFNDASIYFDFNEPVITNLTQIQLVPILVTKEIKSQGTIQLTAIPNPFSESCTIILPDHWKNKNLQYHITSSEGKHHTSHFTKAMDITIQRDELKAGIYFVYLIDDRGNKAYCRMLVQ